MAGHVFITRADLCGLACDAVLVPSDAAGGVESSWFRLLPDLVDRKGEGLVGEHKRYVAFEAPEDWAADGVRTVALGRSDPAGPLRWLTSVGRHRQPASWYVDGARQFLRAAVEATSSTEARVLRKRVRPLLALSPVGTGQGGARSFAGEVIRELLPVLWRAASAEDVDIVLASFTRATYAAAQWARQTSTSKEAAAAWTLSDDLHHHARLLGARAVNGELVPFMGAGVAVSAGLPTWAALLQGLAERAGMAPHEIARLQTLDPTDQARIVKLRLDLLDRPVHLRDALRDLLPAGRYGLTHALLASLPVRESVTTNYDSLFEEASQSIGIDVAVLPYRPTHNADRWLLKLHGSLDAPDGDEPTLTREDYLRFAERRGALAGIVQALLITRHLLFVGFSMTDPNFHRIADEVRRALQPAGSLASEFGTALSLDHDEFRELLWAGEVTFVPVQESCADEAEVAQASATLEQLLDAIGAAAAEASVSHLLDVRFDALLDDGDRELRDELIAFERRLSSRARNSPVWQPVVTALDRMRSVEPLEPRAFGGAGEEPGH